MDNNPDFPTFYPEMVTEGTIDSSYAIYGYCASFPAPRWAEIKSRKTCTHCQDALKSGSTHNCRLCGEIFCSRCSSKYHLPSRYEQKDKQGPSRVCYGCRMSCIRLRQSVEGLPLDSISRSLPAPSWQSIDNYIACNKCTIKRKNPHNCRICGLLYCSDCSSKMGINFPPSFNVKGKLGPQRACDSCRYRIKAGANLIDCSNYTQVCDYLQRQKTKEMHDLRHMNPLNENYQYSSSSYTNNGNGTNMINNNININTANTNANTSLVPGELVKTPSTTSITRINIPNRMSISRNTASQLGLDNNNTNNSSNTVCNTNLNIDECPPPPPPPPLDDDYADDIKNDDSSNGNNTKKQQQTSCFFPSGTEPLISTSSSSSTNKTPSDVTHELRQKLGLLSLNTATTTTTTTTNNRPSGASQHMSSHGSHGTTTSRGSSSTPLMEPIPLSQLGKQISQDNMMLQGTTISPSGGIGINSNINNNGYDDNLSNHTRRRSYTNNNNNTNSAGGFRTPNITSSSSNTGLNGTPILQSHQNSQIRAQRALKYNNGQFALDSPGQQQQQISLHGQQSPLPSSTSTATVQSPTQQQQQPSQHQPSSSSSSHRPTGVLVNGKLIIGRDMYRGAGTNTGEYAGSYLNRGVGQSPVPNTTGSSRDEAKEAEADIAEEQLIKPSALFRSGNNVVNNTGARRSGATQQTNNNNTYRNTTNDDILDANRRAQSKYHNTTTTTSSSNDNNATITQQQQQSR